jgi:hypothetical protein
MLTAKEQREAVKPPTGRRDLKIMFALIRIRRWRYGSQPGGNESDSRSLLEWDDILTDSKDKLG